MTISDVLRATQAELNFRLAQVETRKSPRHRAEADMIRRELTRRAGIAQC